VGSVNYPEFGDFHAGVIIPVRPKTCRKAPINPIGGLFDSAALARLLADIENLPPEESYEKIEKDNVNEQEESCGIGDVLTSAIINSDFSVPVSELVKILNSNGINTTLDEMFDWLRSEGYLTQQQGTKYNMPTPHSEELKLFVVTQTVTLQSNGNTIIQKELKLTGTGLAFFVNYFLNKEVSRKEE